MKTIAITLILSLFFFQLPAQETPRYSAQQYAGFLFGGSGLSGQVQTIHGLQSRKWFAGMGAGIDWYYGRSVPCFLAAERGLKLSENRRIFLSALAGPNFPWRQKVIDDFPHGSSRYITGLYWSSGIGYRLPFGKSSDAFLFHLGFSQKTYKQEVTNVFPCLVPPCPESKDSYKYNLRSVSVKVGWGF